MPTGWPPANVTWPPAGMVALEIDPRNLDVLVRAIGAGWTSAAPTNQENTANFTPARCDLGHPVIGRVLVAPGGTRYPYFAACNTNHDAAKGTVSRAVFFPWQPFYRNDY